MEKYNLDKLIKVTHKDFRISDWYKYKKEIKFFGITFRKEGIYTEVFDDYKGLEPPKNYILKDGIVYSNPEVILHYESNYVKCYVFKSSDEAKEFYNDITGGSKWIS